METPKPTANLNELHSRRHTLRTKHIRYQKTSKELFAKLSDPKNDEDVKDTYSLLRLFSLTFNQINLSREDNKATLPAAFEKDLKKILTEENYNKFDETFKVRGQDFAQSLPASLDKSIVEALIKFVQDNENEHINARYEKDLAELTSQIDGRKGEAASKEGQSQRKKVSTDHNRDEDSLEDQMTTLLKKINNKARFIKLQKDDFEAYSNAQAQFDLLFDDVAMEIMKMKKNLRVKFNKVQKGDQGRGEGRGEERSRGSRGGRGGARNNQRREEK